MQEEWHCHTAVTHLQADYQVPHLDGARLFVCRQVLLELDPGQLVAGQLVAGVLPLVLQQSSSSVFVVYAPTCS